MNRVAACAVLAIAITAILSAQEPPLPGAETIYDLYSPLLLSEGAPLTGGEGPQADAINPAHSGLTQRTTIDASYLALSQVGADGGGWQGHAVNLGLVAPTRVGVFSGSAHLLSLPFEGMPWGTVVAVHGSAAKELYPGWLAGTGLRLMFGGSDRFDFGAAVDLGVVRRAGTVGPLENVTWGVAFQNIGKWFTPVAGAGSLPAPFTPSGSLSFTPVSNSWLDLDVKTTLSAPAFQDLGLGIGARATLFDTVAVHGGWKVSLAEMLRADIEPRNLIPSFGVSVSFRAGLDGVGLAAEQGWSETEVRTTVAAAPLYDNIWAIGGGVNAPLGIIDVEGPAITVDYPEPRYISPNNDGVQDALTIPIEITDDRYVTEWRFEVYDPNGEVIRTIRNVDDRPENTGLQSFVDRVVAVRTGVPIPPQIRWDGRTDAGTIAPDGRYQFRVVAVDDNGNVGTSPHYVAHLDTVPPQVTITPLSAEDLIFSPNDDGFKDEFTIRQEGSFEDLWEAKIVNSSGQVVRTFELNSAAPRPLVWDGTGDDGTLQPDGVYRYRISATDRAGNTGGAELANIIVNTEATPVALRISGSYFSPTGQGAVNTIRLDPDVPNRRGIVDWSIVVRDANGGTVRTFADLASTPQPVVFNGRTDAGTVIPEGEYYAKLEVRYQSGARPNAASPPFVVDMSPPFAAARTDVPVFSPDGDGNIDTITIFNEASREQLWTGRIMAVDGGTVRTFTWTGVPDSRIEWDGRMDDGRLAPDGRYSYVLSATDRAGNIGRSEPAFFELDTSEAEIAIMAEFDAFSPNASGVLDRQRFFTRIDRPDDVAAHTMRILNEAGSVVRHYEGRTALPESITWDGTMDNGRRVPDGRYRADLWVVFTNGFETSAQSALFVVDTIPPSVTAEADHLVFSPDGDSVRREIVITQESSREEEWSAVIRGEDGTVVRRFRWQGTVQPVRWDGRDEAGNLVPDGLYDYEVSATDRAGNSARRTIAGIRVDTRLTRLFVTASTDAFAPNGDGFRETVRFDLFTSVLDGVEEWWLEIRDQTGAAVRRFAGATVEGERAITWDGRDERGDVREGTFTAEYAVDYVKGNRPRASSTPVMIDITPPRARVTLDPVPFSPDNDGVDDQLHIRIEVEDASAIQAWRFEILDRNNRFFNEFSGRGMPASEIVWDGRAADGALVMSAEDYPYRFTVSDVLGNTTVVQGVIPVDILVIRDGDRLRVQIASITFEPDSPELIVDPEDERGARNRAIIKRLGEIFTRYNTYSIQVEGHAVNVTGTDREEHDELQPLSLARADAVMRALVAEGIAERRISTLGRGGTEPVVPHTDLDERWKNRRVEFVLIR